MRAGTIESSFWPETVVILSSHPDPPGEFITVEAIGLRTRTHYTTTIPIDDWRALEPRHTVYTFDGDAQPFRLALEGERLRLAYTADPLLAANNTRVDLLPHQMEAVYDVMLPQPRIRHLMAHDAGAGKTIMGGLLYKELAGRRSNLRTLIVAPAALTRQWQRELREKFLVDFDIVDRPSSRKDDRVWTSSDRLITSTPFARQADVVSQLNNVAWDLVLVDEAHHMAGYSDRETQAYKLGRVLSRNTTHMVLATATPHKGDPKNFLKLLQLLDPDIFDANIVNERPPGRRGNPIMLRRLKEEMVDFDGNRLFLPRRVETRTHSMGANEPEIALYEALTEYISKTYRAAERAGGQTRVNTQFAMVILQRRMASSFAALEQSLLNRRESLLRQSGPEASELTMDPAELEEETEDVRWAKERAAESATPARNREEREKEAAELDRLLELLEAVRRSGRETKVEALQEVMTEIGIAAGNGEKLLVFTESKDTLSFLRRLFEGWGYVVTQIDGGMPPEARIQAEQDFRGHCQIMVATEAAGEGINLQFCAYMVNYDLPWVPTRLEQRMGRIHRYGQTREVRIFNLAAADTREGMVLVGLMNRLQEMRAHLGDQVFDVVSTLISNADLEDQMARVALAATTDTAQERALQMLMDAMTEGEQRQKQWREQAGIPIGRAELREMREHSRLSRLTPEYAQHFFVNALEQLKVQPVALPEPGPTREPGDAAAISLTVTGKNATSLGLSPDHSRLYTFRREVAATRPDVAYLALGTATFDRLLDLVRLNWGPALQKGACFVDHNPGSPEAAFLLWFLAAEVRDGQGDLVEERLFAVRQTPEGLEAMPAAYHNDLTPAGDDFTVPDWAPALSADAQPVIDWSLANQQLPFLEDVRRRRRIITDLRRAPLLADARHAEQTAQDILNEMAFIESVISIDAEQERRDRAAKRVRALSDQFDHEAACSLGPTKVIGVALVSGDQEGSPDEDVDERQRVAAAAMEIARRYEADNGRTTTDMTGGYSSTNSYDLHSTGPGGTRYIEVKGTTNGQVILTENEHVSAQRLRSSYYLYIVTDPLGPNPQLEIIRDPWGRMAHDQMLFSSAKYVYKAATWRAIADRT